MLTMAMPRLIGKTYGRQRKEDNASRVFDEVVLGKVQSTKVTIQKWGQMSFTPSRLASKFGKTDSDEYSSKYTVDKKHLLPPKVTESVSTNSSENGVSYNDEKPSKYTVGKKREEIKKANVKSAESEIENSKSHSILKDKQSSPKRKNEKKQAIVAETVECEPLVSYKDREKNEENGGSRNSRTSVKIPVSNQEASETESKQIASNKFMKRAAKDEAKEVIATRKSARSAATKREKSVEEELSIEKVDITESMGARSASTVAEIKDTALESKGLDKKPLPMRRILSRSLAVKETGTSKNSVSVELDETVLSKNSHSSSRSTVEKHTTKITTEFSSSDDDIDTAEKDDPLENPSLKAEAEKQSISSKPLTSTVAPVTSSNKRKAVDCATTEKTKSEQLDIGNTSKWEKLLDADAQPKRPSLKMVLSSRSATFKSDSVISESKPAEPKPAARRILSGSMASSQKSKAIYNHRQWNIDEEDEMVQNANSGSQGGSIKSTAAASSVFDNQFDDDDVDMKEPPLKRMAPPINHYSRLRDDTASTSLAASSGAMKSSKLLVDREQKELFTVVRNVKQAHECQEIGETQEFKDDIEYLMEGLPATRSLSSRCLTTISLVSKCSTTAFRMHLRAHGTLTKVFSALSDAPQYPTLALCTSAVFFIVSRDRITLDLDEEGLTLLLRLLGSVNDADVSLVREYEQLQRKLLDVFKQFNSRGRVQRLEQPLSEITAGHLSMEALLRLTSKREGEWFKEELRRLKGLDHIIQTVETCSRKLSDCTSSSSSESSTLSEGDCSLLTKIEHCFRVLENVTLLNTDNQLYVVRYKSGCLVKAAFQCMKFCESCLPYNTISLLGDKVDKSCSGYTALTSILATFRVLLNVTHESGEACDLIGGVEGLLSVVLSCILTLPRHLPASERFDLLVLGLGLLINLIENSRSTLDLLLDTSTIAPFDQYPSISSSLNSVDALAMLFSLRYEAAKLIEEEHDAELDEKERQSQELARGSDQRQADMSGEWQELDSGLQWVVNPSKPQKYGASTQGGALSDDCSSVGTSDVNTFSSQHVSQFSQSQNDAETLTKALHRAGKHMEDCIIAAYVSLLVGTVIHHQPYLTESIRDSLPDRCFDGMVRMLRKFLGFMNFTNDVAAGATAGAGNSKSILRVITVLENC